MISVLLVDDEPQVLETTARFLRRCGMHVTCAPSPFGVSALVLREAPDVVVLDFNMPGLDGAHLLPLLRASNRTAATRVIFHSGEPEAFLSTLALTSGASYSCKARGARALADAIVLAMNGPP